MEPNQLSQARVAFKRAVFLVGGQRKMADLLGISQQAVYFKLTRNSVPVKSVAEAKTIEEATGITLHELRPDLYPLEEPRSSSLPAQHPAAHPSAPHIAPLPEEGADGPAASTGGDPVAGLVS